MEISFSRLLLSRTYSILIILLAVQYGYAKPDHRQVINKLKKITKIKLINQQKIENVKMKEIPIIDKLKIESRKMLEIKQIQVTNKISLPPQQLRPPIAKRLSHDEVILNRDPIKISDVPSPQLASTTEQIHQLVEDPIEYQFISSLALINKNRFDSILYLDLKNLEKNKSYQSSVAYFLGILSFRNQRFIDYRLQMIHSLEVSTNEKITRRTLDHILTHLDYFQSKDLNLIHQKIVEQKVSVDTNDQWNYLYAQLQLEKKEFSDFDDLVNKISRLSQYYLPAQILKATTYYRTNKISSSLQILEDLLNDQNYNKIDWNRNIAALTLARIYFQLAEYQKSYRTYLEIDANHPFWLQAMTEQAWAQIQYHDYEGAAGNMFSLHTDYFKNTFNPESYLIRIVGYLNLCQYGDGLHVIESLAGKYQDILVELEKLNKQEKQSATFYFDTYKSVFQNQKPSIYIPKSLLYEIVKLPEVQRLQKTINQIEDENNQFDNILQQAKAETLNIDKEIINSKVSVKNQQSFLLFQNAMKSYIDVRRNRLQFDKNSYLQLTSQEKQKYIKDLNDLIQIEVFSHVKKLSGILQRLQVLNYEVYSGAGEQMRFQFAGGQIQNSKDAQQKLTAEKEKSLQWKFKGEIWEDEVGHYRSSLKNICQSNTQ